ncbi:hypothetical protein NQZ68_019405 [Dissostichus eleginoides]|nr:hypothetical protein NQZ68_019405 [Dissostichus eleginoides]
MGVVLSCECVIRAECEAAVLPDHSHPPRPQRAMADAFLPLCPSHIQLVKAMCTKLVKKGTVAAADRRGAWPPGLEIRPIVPLQRAKRTPLWSSQPISEHLPPLDPAHQPILKARPSAALATGTI